MKIYKILSDQNKTIKKSNSIFKSFCNKTKYFNSHNLKINTSKAVDLISKQHDQYNDASILSRVTPDIKPGFLRYQIPEHPPTSPEGMDEILQDVERLILPNMMHWQHPKFFGFFPSNITDSALVGDLISSAFNTPGFTWHANPSATELENIIMDWCVKLLNLPENFLIKNRGGGTISNSIGDAILLSVIAGKYKKMKELNIDCSDPKVLNFVGYYTEHSHMQHHKALCIKDIPYKKPLPVEFDELSKNFKLKKGFEKIIEEDIKNGFIPCWLGGTIGTTSTGAQDDILLLSEICKKHKIYLTIDCAWAGSYFILDEYKSLSQSLEGVNSFCINFAKMMLSGMPSTLFYVNDKLLLNESLSGKNSQLYQNPEYLKNQFSDLNDVIDYKDWQIGLGRRFNSLKIWFIIRSFGADGLKSFIKNSIKLAETFENLLSKDNRFEMVCKREFSLICFRVIKDKENNILPKEKLNEINLSFLNNLNKSGEVCLVGSKINDIYFMRSAFGSTNSTVDDVEFLWTKIIQNFDF